MDFLLFVWSVLLFVLFNPVRKARVKKKKELNVLSLLGWQVTQTYVDSFSKSLSDLIFGGGEKKLCPVLPTLTGRLEQKPKHQYQPDKL